MGDRSLALKRDEDNVVILHVVRGVLGTFDLDKCASVHEEESVSSAPDTAHDSTRAERAFRGLARLQARHPLWFVAIALLLTAVGGGLATRLSLMLRFEQLLPETRPSVVELARLSANVRAGSHAFVLVEGGDAAGQRAFGDALVERIRARAPLWLVEVSDGVQDGRRFLRPRAGMFISLAELQRLYDDVEARWSWEVGKQTGTNLDDEPPPDLAWDKLKQRLGLAGAEQYPDGYFQAKNPSALVVVVNTSIEGGDLATMQAALSLIQSEARALRQHQPKAFQVSFAGDLVTGLAEYGAVTRDLLSVGLLGIGLVLGVLFLYFRRLRALVALSATLSVGLAATFGLTELLIGHLNVATGFLVSIVAGGGINFGIIYLARFFEERRRGVDPQRALAIAHTGTWLGTSTAALAAAAAYGSLGISEFRAFRDFALIGSMGMIVCWLVSYSLLPALLILCERFRPFSPPEAAATSTRAASVGQWTPPVGAARWIAFGGVGLALAGVATLVPYVRHDPMEYDMRQMQNNLGGSGDMYRAARIAGQIVGAKLDGAMLLLADRPGQVPDLKRVLEARRDRAPAGQKPFEAVHTAFDFVPDHQSEKLPLLQRLAGRIHKAHARGFVSEADFQQLEPFLPPDTLTPWHVTDLPEMLTRPFTDRAGVVGRLALIEPAAGQSDSDVKYLMRWADSFRSVRLPSGESIRGSGRAVIFADILSTVLHDIPRTVALAFFATVASVLLAFRRGWHASFVLASLLVGVGWVAFGMTLLHLKINFFNFVALPVSFGIGVDYSVNLMQRYAAEPKSGVMAALRRSGGAVVLCSMTTILGYLALLASVNQAIRSLGLLAVVGEIGCLAAATLVLPAWLYLRERRTASASIPPGTNEPGDAEPAAS